jgi:hypothetical protein
LTRAVQITLFGLLLAGAAGVLLWGRGYYLEPGAERVYSPQHQIFASSRPLGHGLGVLAFLLFLANFGYQLRKGLRLLQAAGTLAAWMRWHVLGGLGGALLVALHSTFEMRNWMTRTCVYSLGIVVLTGIIGRYLLSFVPRTASGERMSLSALQDQIMGHVDALRPLVVHDRRAVKALQGLVDAVDPPALVGVQEPLSLRYVRARLAESRGQMALLRRAVAGAPGHSGAAGRDLDRLIRKTARLSRRVAVVHVAGYLMDNWRNLHRAFALLLLLTLLAHVAVAIYLGYLFQDFGG